MKRSNSGGAFTLIELLMVIAIIACVAALLMPALTAVRQKADGIACMSNLRQIGIAGQLFAEEHSQTTPVMNRGLPSRSIHLGTARRRSLPLCSLMDVLFRDGRVASGN